MSMADCEKCWDAVCSCGYDYLTWAPDRLAEQAKLLLDVAAFLDAYPVHNRGGLTGAERQTAYDDFKRWRKP